MCTCCHICKSTGKLAHTVKVHTYIDLDAHTPFYYGHVQTQHYHPVNHTCRALS